MDYPLVEHLEAFFNQGQTGFQDGSPLASCFLVASIYGAAKPSPLCFDMAGGSAPNRRRQWCVTLRLHFLLTEIPARGWEPFVPLLSLQRLVGLKRGLFVL